MQGLSLAKSLHVYYIIRPNIASCKLQKKQTKEQKNTEKENKRQGELL